MTDGGDVFAPCIGVPDRFVSGDSWAFARVDIFDLFPDPGFALDVVFSPKSGGAPVTVVAANEGNSWVCRVDAATSAAWTPGVWCWAAVVRNIATGERATFDQGEVQVLPDPATSTADQRSQARRILEAIEATIEGRVVKDVDNYSIEGRSLTRIPMEELIKLRTRYRSIVRKEESPGSGGVDYRRVSL